MKKETIRRATSLGKGLIGNILNLVMISGTLVQGVCSEITTRGSLGLQGSVFGYCFQSHHSWAFPEVNALFVPFKNNAKQA